MTFADGVVAIFTRTADTTQSDYIHWWVWGNVAHNAKDACFVVASVLVCGAPIDRDGTIIINKNTSGITGGSAAIPPNYYIYSTPISPGSTAPCTYSSYATMPDGEVIGSSGFGPC